MTKDSLAFARELRYLLCPVSRWFGKTRRPEDRPVIRLLQAIDVCYARIYHHVLVRSPCNLPRGGPCIFICNHTSHLDPLLIQSVCPRLITWMMTADFYDIGWLQPVFRAIGAIRVERKGRDMAAVRAAMRALEEGRVLGIFPEGRIEPKRELLPFQTGVALIAAKAGVPIYPAYLDGSQRKRAMAHEFLHRQRASLTFGPPITLDPPPRTRQDLEAVTKRLQDRVDLLRIGEMARTI